MTTAPAKATEARNLVSLAVGDRLKESRIRANISQLKLAAEAHVDRVFISNIERGVANPSVIVLANICHVLGMTLAEFFSELDIALPPQEDEPRRTNAAQPKVKPPGSRLR
ncbi:helix-turn-helix transcriptional regulator [Massilia forsythiae]|uniref:Helix-turn-helix transcriptional regulator n=1 Tax=Massilia forsythiae TaxID=2728020 RepID=A0A7Z2VVB1_9BURK|nr:helix-turn-helix transcriptional regulator [Massilia forsythiae]QJD99838.1 helix-turn-helix transcriptional regulator [Massilia forsythiae]